MRQTLAALAVLGLMAIPSTLEAQNPSGWCEDCMPEVDICVWLTQGYNGCRDNGGGGGYCSTIPWAHCNLNPEITISPSGVAVFLNAETDSPPIHDGAVLRAGCRLWVVGLTREDENDYVSAAPPRLIL